MSALTRHLVSIGFNPREATFLGWTMADSLTATGTTQGTGYAIDKTISRFTTVTGADYAATLPIQEAWANAFVLIVNGDSADTMTIFPGVGEYIGGGAVNTGVTLAAGSAALFAKCDSTNNKWVALGASSGSGGGGLGADWSLLGNSGTVDGTNFLGTTDSVALTLRTNNTARWKVGTSGTLEQQTNGSDIVLTNSTAVFRQDTSDGADNKRFSMCGGGADSNTRGAILHLSGNEHASTPGEAELAAGNVGSGDLRLAINNATGTIKFLTASATLRWKIESDGKLVCDSTNGGNLNFERAEKGVSDHVTTGISANGTTQGAATAIADIVNVVGTVNSTNNGVVLSNNTINGLSYYIFNDDAADTLYVYPPSGKGINRLGTNVPAKLRPGQSGLFKTYSSANYLGIFDNGIKILFDHYADVGNVGTGDDDLYSDTLVAGQLNIDGDKISAHYAGLFVGDATSTQRLRAYFGGTSIFDSGALVIGATTAYWDLRVELIRESSSVVRCSAALNTSFATLYAYSAYTRVTGLTLANAQILKITGEAAGATAATDQIIAKLGHVEFKGVV